MIRDRVKTSIGYWGTLVIVCWKKCQRRREGVLAVIRIWSAGLEDEGRSGLEVSM